MTPDLLQVRGLCKVLHRPTRKTLLDNIHLELKRGEVCTLLGQNGSGKTTLMKTIAGLLRPTSGEVQLAPGVRLGAAFEATRCFYPRLSVQENLGYFVRLRQQQHPVVRVEHLIEAFDLQQHRHTPAQHLSRGNQQKLSLAIAFAGQPNLLLLDEPTLGLDVGACARLIEQVREQARQGTGILLATHDMSFAEQVSGKLVVLKGGQKLAEGRTPQVLADFQHRTYGVQLGRPLDEATLLSLAPHLQSREGNRLLLRLDASTFPQVMAQLYPHSIETLTLEKNSVTGFFTETLQRGPHALA